MADYHGATVVFIYGHATCFRLWPNKSDPDAPNLKCIAIMLAWNKSQKRPFFAMILFFSSSATKPEINYT